MSQSARLTFFLVALIAMLPAVFSSGCVRRTITITSEPSGALVHLNDTEIGRTPVTVGFTHYGVYDVRLSHEGRWVDTENTLQALGLDADQLQTLAEAGQIESRTHEGETQFRIGYLPLWVEASTTMPWWDLPGIDLVSELTPGIKRSRQNWHFQLVREGPQDEQLLIGRANQMRALLRETFPDPPDETSAPEPQVGD